MIDLDWTDDRHSNNFYQVINNYRSRSPITDQIKIDPTLLVGELKNFSLYILYICARYQLNQPPLLGGQRHAHSLYIWKAVLILFL